MAVRSGPKEALILTVLETVALKTTPEDADREDDNSEEKETRLDVAIFRQTNGRWGKKMTVTGSTTPK